MGKKHQKYDYFFLTNRRKHIIIMMSALMMQKIVGCPAFRLVLLLVKLQDASERKGL